MTTLRDLMRDTKASRATLTPKSLASYLKENGAPADTLDTTVADAIHLSRTASPTYGALAEALSETGLSNSGYRDYLATRADKAKAEATATAYETYLNDKRTAEAGYEAYLSQADGKRVSRTSDVLRYATTLDTVDGEDIARYARLLGFSAADAAELSARAVDTVQKQRRASVLQTVVDRSMTGQEADAYARALGFSDEESRAIARFADELRRTVLSGIDLTDN